jgi:hypothetical protein
MTFLEISPYWKLKDGVNQLAKKFSDFMKQLFITVITKDRHWTLSRASAVQSPLLHHKHIF